MHALAQHGIITTEKDRLMFNECGRPIFVKGVFVCEKYIPTGKERPVDKFATQISNLWNNWQTHTFRYFCPLNNLLEYLPTWCFSSTIRCRSYNSDILIDTTVNRLQCCNRANTNSNNKNNTNNNAFVMHHTSHSQGNWKVRQSHRVNIFVYFSNIDG